MLRIFLNNRATQNHVSRLNLMTRKLQGLVVGVPKESLPGEERVAIAPVHVTKLTKAGAVIKIQKDAGVGSGYSNELYEKAGAKVVSAEEAWKSAVVAKVRPPTADEAKLIENRSIVSIIQPRINTELMDQLMAQKATVFSLDSLLRTLSRGQAFDVLSSQANVAGYDSSCCCHYAIISFGLLTLANY